MDTGGHRWRLDARSPREQVHRLHRDGLLAGLLGLLSLAPRRAVTAAAARTAAVPLNLEYLFTARSTLLVRVINIESAAVFRHDLCLLLLRDEASAVPEAFVGEVLAAMIADLLLRLLAGPFLFPVPQNPLALLLDRQWAAHLRGPYTLYTAMVRGRPSRALLRSLCLTHELRAAGPRRL